MTEQDSNADGGAPSAPVDPVNLSAEEATAEIGRWSAEIANDPNHAYRDNRHPNHKDATTRMMTLYERAGGGGASADPAADGESKPAPAGGETTADGADGPRDGAEYSFERLAARADVGGHDLAASIDAVRGWAAEARIDQPELDVLIGRHNELARDPNLHDPARIADAQRRSLAGLQAIWPGAEFAAKTQAAMRAVARLDGGTGNLKAVLEDTRLGDDPWTIRMFAEVAARNDW